MRSFFRGLWLSLGLVAFVAGGANAAMAPSIGPDPSWTDGQKFEWYLGYMSAASALCNDFSRASELSDVATLSPYGRIGLNSINFDAFIGGACPKIRNQAKELLQKKDAYIRYLSAAYDCAPGGKCLGGPKPNIESNHVCAKQVDRFLEGLSIKNAEVKSINMQTEPGHLHGGAAPHRAQVRLKSCAGALWLEFTKNCAVKHSYTRGDCEIAGVDGY